jgi:hypothetical protein
LGASNQNGSNKDGYEICQSKPLGRGKVGRPRLRWLEDAEWFTRRRSQEMEEKCKQ